MVRAITIAGSVDREVKTMDVYKILRGGKLPEIISLCKKITCSPGE
jgi:hypothetical protein